VASQKGAQVRGGDQKHRAILSSGYYGVATTPSTAKTIGLAQDIMSIAGRVEMKTLRVPTSKKL